MTKIRKRRKRLPGEPFLLCGNNLLFVTDLHGCPDGCLCCSKPGDWHPEWGTGNISQTHLITELDGLGIPPVLSAYPYLEVRGGGTAFCDSLFNEPAYSCLLYTSDAADDLLCVDLGGRRIIKKKKQ